MMQRVQQELGHLVIGKAVSTLMGLVVLLLMWRRVAPTAYGHYLSLVAAAEILSLVSALGISTVAQRYLPIWMAHADSVWHAMGRIAQVLILRIILAGLFLFGCLSVSTFWPHAATDWAATAAQPWALGLVMMMVLMRSLEEVQVVLLMQAWIQALAVAGHGLRLMALSMLGPADTADLAWLIHLELAIAGAVVGMGLATMGWRVLGGHHRDDALRHEQPSTWWTAWNRSLPFWLTQCLGLAWSIHTLRLLLHAVAGPVAVAVHGVAHAMVESWRQATPLVWATGWLRAAMLRLYTSPSPSTRALDLASSVHRLSALMLWPVVAAWCVEPLVWYRWVAGSAMFSKAQDLGSAHPWAPPVSALLAATALLAPLQNRHLLISLWTFVHQRPGWGVLASVAAVIPVAAFGWLWSLAGLWSVPIVMLAAEFLWVRTAGVAWLADRRIREDRWRSLRLPVAALASAGIVSLLLGHMGDPSAATRLMLPLLAAAVAVGVLSWWRGLLTANEKAALVSCLPPTVLAWQGSRRRAL